MAIERTFSIIKPDATKRNLTGAVNAIIEGAGLRIRAACERFHDVTHLTQEEVARRMRELDIDIVVDLKGHTRGSRFDLLAWRPAILK